MGYRIKIKNTTSTDYNNKKCFLGISVTNPLYLNKHKVQKVIDWMDLSFNKEKVLLIGDVLHTFNLNMFTEYKKLNLEEEKEKGELILHNLKQATNLKKDFSIMEWPIIKSKEEVLNFKKEINDLFLCNNDFKSEILVMANTYVNKKIQKGFTLNIERRDAINASVCYLLEELAVFSYLIDKGYVTQIYFGTQLPLLKKVATGEIVFESNLKNGIYIDANLKKV